jgi:hypothetical protein
MADAPTLTRWRCGVGTQLHQLVDEYGGDRRDAVRQLVTQERSRFSDARVHAFVPILLERSVRSRLNQLDYAEDRHSPHDPTITALAVEVEQDRAPPAARYCPAIDRR